jgi:geranylgeranyl reductase family protein
MISIIGAGPTGSYCAYLLAKNGFEVNLYEEHPKVGLPVQCTGIVTKNLFKYVPKSKNFIINKFEKVQTVAPNNDYAEIPIEEYLLDRTKFDNYILNKAADNGAQIHYNHKFKQLKNNKAILKTKQGLISNKFNFLIGADGPNSTVAKQANLYNNRDFLIGMQARVRGHFNKNTFTTFFGNRLTPNFFAWVVPESTTTARVGLATKNNTHNHFQFFLKSLNFQILEYQGGLIPIYNHKQKLKKDNIYLIGDAATLTKATTGGGLVTGLESARLAAVSIIKNKNYEKEMKKTRFNLKIHKKVRKTLNNFNDKDYIKLINIMKKKKIQNILKKENRDFPLKMLLKLAIKEPRLLCFLK